MKLAPLLFAASLAANAALVGYVALRPSPGNISRTAESGAARTANPSGNHPKPSAGTWAVVHSDDLSAYTANLRAAGLPDRLVRMIINAEINERFKAREEALRPARPPRKYWEKDDYLNGDKLTLEQRLGLIDLRREKDDIRRALLGEDPSKPVDDNPVPVAKRTQLKQITEDYDAMISQLQRESKGFMLPSDDEKLRFLRSEKDKEINELLTPAERTEYDLRSSQTAQQLRWRLSSFAPTEEEFRALYPLQKSIDENFPQDGTNNDPAFWQKRQDAEKAMKEQLRQQLSPERFAEYERSRNWDYQNLKNLAERLGLPPSTAAGIYDLRNTISAESKRIESDPKLATNDAKLDALAALAQKTRDQIYAQLGREGGDAYIKRSANWLSQVEKGGVIEFHENGSSSHQLPPRSTPAR
ncbi:MAG: hypothetical protein WC661_17755 [Opitutaceae bacterium]|jgi:hypothetical protein